MPAIVRILLILAAILTLTFLGYYFSDQIKNSVNSVFGKKLFNSNVQQNPQTDLSNFILIEKAPGFKFVGGTGEVFCRSSELIDLSISQNTKVFFKNVVFDLFDYLNNMVSSDTVCTSDRSQIIGWLKKDHYWLTTDRQLLKYDSQLDSSNQTSPNFLPEAPKRPLINTIEQPSAPADLRPEKAKKYDMVPIAEISNYSYPNQMDKLYCVAAKVYIPSATNGKEVLTKVFFDAFYFPSIWVTKDASCTTSYKKLYEKYKGTEYGSLSSGGEIFRLN